ncbi:hypothetical protein JET18_00895 [Chryseobacterium sp. L7]|uniref:Spi protease inhibitor domain-containing protein n=1 Tax=Chryseobacterium endalhagicum TaxID=2797638 RepID=A0ABS1Q9U3_9FLAO|nr:hypothetical protein [Chryseobacterium endalhagicum]MBL1219379.1 hypothetical protein [Chryseobacterium endalhagicum]
MRKKIILRLFFLTAFMALLWSCRSEDFAKNESESQRNNADFFKHQVSKFSKDAPDYISILENYNKEKDFLSTMSDQKGMPLWDKMKVIAKETETGLIIPLSHDNENMSSIIFVSFDSKNTVTGINNCDNNTLQNIVYDGKIEHDIREELLYTFMYMDNQTFGNEYFTAIPEDLFKGKKYNLRYGRMKLKDFETPDISGNEANKIITTESCSNYWSCKNHETWSSCDHCGLCYMTSCTTVLIYIPEGPSVPGGGNPGNPDNGGGGVPGSGPPPKDPCRVPVENGPFYKLHNPCENGNPDDTFGEDPCKIAKGPVSNVNNIIHVSTIASEVKALESHAKNSFTEYGMAVVNAGSSIIAQDPYSNNDPSNPGSVNIIYPTIGDPLVDAHSHPSHGAAPPSVKDLYATINTAQIYPTYLGSFVFAHNGTKYAFVITNKEKALLFLENYPISENTTNEGRIFNTKSDLGTDFNEIYKSFMSGKFPAYSGSDQNDGMESAYAYILEKYDVGINLAKTDAGGQLKPLKSVSFKHTIPASGGKKVTAFKAEPCP